jgi:hypothetical protein
VSDSLDEFGIDGSSALVNVVVTRRIRGQLLGEVTLVDRTCVGVTPARMTISSRSSHSWKRVVGPKNYDVIIGQLSGEWVDEDEDEDAIETTAESSE